ncbi:polysaccharide export outer membrane protein [Amaricoccus macauensis]|uniref:Polysaccharide export outer membrane protein n=1 Tax=Amaricoccus macauensis TaxID=57001 RepID=A0A840SSF1_9RHOB|nr:polysaccharide biosynthesis/export family protein [Amaricoccus macauensis]MBB5222132.1 polysaccharide export outer membrane protein [Amaricoccus macauensis]
MQARADYLVQRGDVLFVSIAEDHDAGREAKVNADGRIMLPHIGGVMVAGSDLDTIRHRIESSLSDQAIIRKPTVVVEVSTYRPVYVGGAVARPGAIGFDVGLTVRQALVLAGGVDRSGDPKLPTTEALLELKAKFKTNAAELVDVDGSIARLRAALTESPKMDTAGVARAGVAPQDTASILSLDDDLLRDELATRAADAAHLEDLVSLVDFEIDTLAKQATLQEAEQKSQQSEVETATKLHEKGLLPLPRVQELERERSRLQRDLLENQSFTARAQQNKASSEYDLRSADAKWRVDLQEKLRGALVHRMKLKAESEVIAGSLVAAGVSLVGDDAFDAVTPEVIIHRNVEGHDQTIDADMDTEILPADVLDVSVATGGSAG